MSYGEFIQNWTGGSPGRGNFEYRLWSGSNASAAERAAGILKPHPYSKTVTRVRSPKIQVKGPYDQTPYESWANHYFSTPREYYDIWTSNHWNALLSELYAKVKGGDFNASVATAELGQTLSSIANVATRVYRAYRYARKGRLRDAAVALTGANNNRLSNKAATKEMATNWLELQYGWLPLLGDVHAGTELLANYLHRPFTKAVRVRKQVTFSRSGYAHNGVTYGSLKVRHRAQIIAFLSESVSGYATLGLTDPYTVAWELLPYSFVLDWFLPIGPWLEAAAAARTLKGTFFVTHAHLLLAKGLHSGSTYKIQGGDTFHHEFFEMKRTESTALSAQLPTFKPLAKVASLGHCLNALALLESLRR